jgi:hypothetical protein
MNIDAKVLNKMAATDFKSMFYRLFTMIKGIKDIQHMPTINTKYHINRTKFKKHAFPEMPKRPLIKFNIP